MATIPFRLLIKAARIDSMLPRRLIAWLFTLALLWGQGAAFAHALEHLHPHDSTLPDPVCALCVAQAQLGSALPTLAPLLTHPPLTQALTAHTTPVCAELAPHSACARGPPVQTD